MNHLGYCPLPSYEEVIEAMLDLKDLLYPGYRRRVGLHAGNIIYHVGGLIDSLHDRLTVQIGRALRHEDRVTHRHGDCEADIRSEEHTSELQSRENLVCRLLLEKKN